MKIGIISKISKHNINYGNYLQSFALNYYVRNCLSHKNMVETLLFDDVLSTTSYTFQGNRLITKRMPVHVFFGKLLNKGRHLLSKKCEPVRIERRKEAFLKFANKHIVFSKQVFSWKTLQNSDYDAIIVGSDVVWQQHRYSIDRIQFLDFSAQKRFKKISYAASFGSDWIPKENEAELRRCLKDFAAISVREKSSIQLLKGIGIDNASHAIDPVLLLSETDWERLEVKPDEVPENENFAFVYLLGTNYAQYKEIKRISENNGLKLVNIPYASGEKNDLDESFGNIRVIDCSPQNFLWLVHHAKFVWTDSFHGLVFSTIFQKRFIAVDRNVQILSNRLVDYLDTIGQKDKILSIEKMKQIDSVNELQWDYKDINNRIEICKKASIKFLKKSLGEQ